MVGKHDDVKPAAVDCRLCNRLKVGRVGRDAHKTHFASRLEASKSLVYCRVEQSLNGVATVYVDEINIAEAHPLKTRFHSPYIGINT